VRGVKKTDRWKGWKRNMGERSKGHKGTKDKRKEERGSGTKI
jgi:hypothetical protein